MASLKVKTSTGWVKVGGNEPIPLKYAEFLNLLAGKKKDGSGVIGDGQFIANQQYTITDFETKITEAVGATIGVTAAFTQVTFTCKTITVFDDPTTPTAITAKATFFEDCTFPNQPLWKGKYVYEVDDTNKDSYLWVEPNTTADKTKNFGVITFLEDEYGNSANYDFKSIYYLLDDGAGGTKKTYTFDDGANGDLSTTGNVKNVKIKSSILAKDATYTAYTSYGLPYVFFAAKVANNVAVDAGVAHFTIPNLVDATTTLNVPLNNIMFDENCGGYFDTTTVGSEAWVDKKFEDLTDETYVANMYNSEALLLVSYVCYDDSATTKEYRYSARKPSLNSETYIQTAEPKNAAIGDYWVEA